MLEWLIFPKNLHILVLSAVERIMLAKDICFDIILSIFSKAIQSSEREYLEST